MARHCDSLNTGADPATSSMSHGWRWWRASAPGQTSSDPANCFPELVKARLQYGDLKKQENEKHPQASKNE